MGDNDDIEDKNTTSGSYEVLKGSIKDSYFEIMCNKIK